MPIPVNAQGTVTSKSGVTANVAGKHAFCSALVCVLDLVLLPAVDLCQHARHLLLRCVHLRYSIDYRGMHVL